jgi:hypothetical protein
MDSLHFLKDFSPPGTSSRKISIPITDLLCVCVCVCVCLSLSLSLSLSRLHKSLNNFITLVSWLLTLSTKYWAPLATSSSSKFLITAGFLLYKTAWGSRMIFIVILVI